MRLRTRLCAAATSVAAVGASAQAGPIPIEDLARKPAITSVSMSVDGDYIVALVTPPGDDENLALAVWDLEEGGAPTITPSNDRMKFVSAQALKQDKLSVVGIQAWTGQLDGCGEGKSVGTTKTFLTKFYTTDTEMKDFEEAFAKRSGRRGSSKRTERCFEIAGTASYYGNMPLDPNDVVVQRRNTETFRTEYYRVDLESGEEDLLYRADTQGLDLLDYRTGEVLATAELGATGGDFEQRSYVRNPETGEREEQPPLRNALSSRHTMNIVGYDERTGKYYVVTDKFDQTADVYFYDARTQSFDDEPLFALEKFDVTGVMLGSKPSNFNELIGFSYGADRRKAYYLDPERRAVIEGLETAFPGQHVTMIDYTDDYERVLFSTDNGANPPAYHLLTDKKAVQTLGTERPGMDTSSLTPSDLVYYEARDGMRIPAILDLPAGFEPGVDDPIPAVIHPHGGPWARDDTSWDFSGWVPFLTSRGYAVLRPQFRGSDGWGHDLWLAGDSEWGQKMQDDKDDGASFLVEQGIADPDQLAIFGYSYGGFAAFAATVREDSPYQCAIAGAGVSNLDRIRGWGDNRVQRIFQGRTIDGMDPIENTDKANIPILIFHGDRDVRVPLFHSTDFYDKVKKKVPAELLVLDDMGHEGYKWQVENTVDTLEAMEKFLGDECGMQARAPGGDEGGRGD